MAFEKPKTVEEMLKKFVAAGYMYPFQSFGHEMFNTWPDDAVLLTLAEAKHEAKNPDLGRDDPIPGLMMLRDRSLDVCFPKHETTEKSWPILRRNMKHAASQRAATKPTVDEEHARMMQFFFGCKPSDPDKLPPPPQSKGWSFDYEIDG